MPELPAQRITIHVDLEDIETVLEFAEINLELIDEKEFKYIRESVSAVYEAVNIGRRAEYEKKIH